MWQTKLHTHTGQQAKLQFCIFQSSYFWKANRNTKYWTSWSVAFCELDWEMLLLVSLRANTLHLLMYTLEHYEQGLALCTVCSVCVCLVRQCGDSTVRFGIVHCVQCLCVSCQAVWWQHRPVWHCALCAVSVCVLSGSVVTAPSGLALCTVCSVCMCLVRQCGDSTVRFGIMHWVQCLCVSCQAVWWQHRPVWHYALCAVSVCVLSGSVVTALSNKKHTGTHYMD